MWLAATLVSFALAVAGHAILCRFPYRVDFVAKSLLVGAPFGLLLAGFQAYRKGMVIGTAASALLYSMLFELYIFCFTLVSTSVSVSILLQVADRELTAGEIERLYSDKSMVEGRFEKLLRTDFLAREHDAYRVTPKARILLAAFRTIRFFFRHPSANP